MNIELTPKMARGEITEINDAAIRVEIKGRMGVITVPLRWVFAEKPLELGQEVEFYFSYMNVI
jgi:hypothetical protein